MIAYSGQLDRQKQAADVMAGALPEHWHGTSELQHVVSRSGMSTLSFDERTRLELLEGIIGVCFAVPGHMNHIIRLASWP